MKSNLFSDIEGTTNPIQRKEKKKFKLWKFILNKILKSFLFFVKHKKKIIFIVDASLIIITLLIIKKIIYLWIQ